MLNTTLAMHLTSKKVDAFASVTHRLIQGYRFRVGPYRFCGASNPTTHSILLWSYLILSDAHITNECLYIATCSGKKQLQLPPDAWDECEVQRTAGSEKSPPGSAPGRRVIFLSSSFSGLNLFWDLFLWSFCRDMICMYNVRYLCLWTVRSCCFVLQMLLRLWLIDDCWCYMDCTGWSSLLFSAGRRRMMESLYHSMPKQSLSIHSNIF